MLGFFSSFDILCDTLLFPGRFRKDKTFSYLKVIFEDVSFEIKFYIKNTARPSS